MTRIEKLNVDGVGRLPTFSHAVVAGDWIFVSGSLGTKPGSFELVPGGAGPQTAQTLANIRAILAGCGATLADVVKVNVFLTDMTTFREMNEAYLAAFPGEPPARITVGCAGLALGAAVEIDCIALAPKTSSRASRKAPKKKARRR
jgi:2-iminobutanoate/2-iminopropanoate deaminase